MARKATKRYKYRKGRRRRNRFGKRTKRRSKNMNGGFITDLANIVNTILF